MQVSAPLDLVPRAKLEPGTHPETLMRSNTTSLNKPRTLPAGVPGLPHPKQRVTPSQPAPTVAATAPEPTLIKANPWKLTREFDEILGPYQEPELVPQAPATPQNTQPYQWEAERNYQPRQQLQIEDYSYAMDASQRGTLNIAYDPNWSRQQQPQPRERVPENQTSNPLDLGYVDKKSQTFVSQQEIGPEPSPEERPYQADWITAETADITDRNYYDADASADSYTHQAVAVRAAVPTMINYSSSGADDEFERPRQVPAFNPRSTRVILKEDIDFLKAVRDGTEPPPPLPIGSNPTPTLPAVEENGRSRSSSLGSITQDDFVRQQDVDFYLALLGGSEPPAASPETDALVHEEEEMRRRNEAAAAEEAERRRLEELQTTQNDLDFLAALMQ